jgi:hypothetical protein
MPEGRTAFMEVPKRCCFWKLSAEVVAMTSLTPDEEGFPWSPADELASPKFLFLRFD